MSDESIRIHFGESENWTVTRVLGVEKWDEIDSEDRCGCGAIGEFTLRLDMISSGDEQEIDVCRRCLAKYTHGFDRDAIFRDQKKRDFPDRYC